MASKSDKLWRQWLRELRDRVPLSKPASVRRLKKPLNLVSESAAKESGPSPSLGYATMTKHGFSIGISAIEPIGTQLDTLLHEWAHCVAYPKQRLAGTTWKHDGLFGVAYAETYRKFYQEPTP